jgi:hypothetical protein
VQKGDQPLPEEGYVDPKPPPSETVAAAQNTGTETPPEDEAPGKHTGNAPVPGILPELNAVGTPEPGRANLLSEALEAASSRISADILKEAKPEELDA